MRGETFDVLAAQTPSVPVSARIAVVEDDDAIRALIADLLEGEGYRCLAAPSWESGADLLEGQQPDLLILDIVFDGRASGWKLLDQLSRNPHTAAIPVIVCTADASALVNQRAILRVRGIRCLAKPFDVQDLLTLIKDGLNPFKPAAEPDGLDLEHAPSASR